MTRRSPTCRSGSGSDRRADLGAQADHCRPAGPRSRRRAGTGHGLRHSYRRAIGFCLDRLSARRAQRRLRHRLAADATGWHRAGPRVDVYGRKGGCGTLRTIGLVNRVVPDDKLQDEAFALAKAMAEGPTLALRYMKDNLDEALQFDFATARDHEATRLVRLTTTADHKEAVQAFIDKRKPVFRGN